MVTRCVMKNDKKEKIWDLFDQKENANDIQTMILEYENEFSDDMDIFLMKMSFLSMRIKYRQQLKSENRH